MLKISNRVTKADIGNLDILQFENICCRVFGDTGKLMEKRKYVTGTSAGCPALWAESFTYGELLFTFGAEGEGL